MTNSLIGRWAVRNASVALVALAAACSLATADEWPQWRGPGRDGVWRETGIVQEFASKKLTPSWTAPVGAGYSGPTVADGRVYLMDLVREGRGTSERILCFDAASGESKWTFDYECEYRQIGYSAGPRASVSLDEGRTYSLGAMGYLHCLDAATGEIVWAHDLNAEYEIRLPELQWGVAASPIIEGDLAIVQVGGVGICLAAFDKRTGELRWRALEDRASYSAPIVIEQAGRRVLVCWTGDNVVGLDPTDGSTLWSHPFQPKKMVLAVATPVVDADRLFLTGFYDGSMMLRLHSDKLAVDELWRRSGPSEQRTDALHSIISTPLLDDGYIYGVDSYGEFRCLDAATGDRVWMSQEPVPYGRWATVHMVRNGDRVWMFNEQGELIISRLSPSGYEEISRAQLIEVTAEQSPRLRNVCWSHPAFAYKHIFARNDKQLVCASLAAE